jgi:hypothetical protein
MTKCHYHVPPPNSSTVSDSHTCHIPALCPLPPSAQQAAKPENLRRVSWGGVERCPESHPGKPSTALDRTLDGALPLHHPGRASITAAPERITGPRLHRGNHDFAAANADRPWPLLHLLASYRPRARMQPLADRRCA